MYNYRILIALCLSQFNEEWIDFKKEGREEMIVDMNSRFNYLVKEIVESVSYFKNLFDYLIRTNKKYFNYNKINK